MSFDLHGIPVLTLYQKWGQCGQVFNLSVALVRSCLSVTEEKASAALPSASPAQSVPFPTTTVSVWNLNLVPS